MSENKAVSGTTRASSTAQNQVTAIDILLDPDATMIEQEDERLQIPLHPSEIDWTCWHRG
jgi:hypothetical protein